MAMMYFFNVQAKVYSNFDEYAISAIVFSLIWSTGAILTEEARSNFHQFILNLIKGSNLYETYQLKLETEPRKLKIMFNDHMIQNMYNVCYQRKEKMWQNWLNTENIAKISANKYNVNLIQLYLIIRIFSFLQWTPFEIISSYDSIYQLKKTF